jgi:hypothetical protein
LLQHLHLRLLAELGDQVGLAFLAFEFLQHGADTFFHFGQRGVAGAALIGDLDDVEAVRRADDLAELAGRERERRLFERLLHLALGDVTEVAAAWGGAGVLRLLVRQGGEIATGLELVEQCSGTLLRRRAVGSAGALRDANQDVADTDLCRMSELFFVAVVEALHLLRSDFQVLPGSAFEQAVDGHGLLRVAAQILLGHAA